jgi:glycosyltransferase involved in cell wall biosynthesis
MKVLVVGTGGSIVSGISTAADEMARTLPDFGHDTERLNSGEQMRRHSNTLNLENVGAVLADAAAVARRARRGRADVVWIHTFGVPTLPALRALAMVVAARVTGCRAVVHFHAFGLESAVAGSGRSLRIVVRVLAVFSGALVVVHEEAANALRRFSGASSVHVLPNWVEVPDEVAPPPPQPPLRVVFVGGLVRRKGVPQLIEAMRALGDVPVELRLVGGSGEDGPSALEQLKASASDLVATGRLAFAGELDSEGVRGELRACHLFVLASEAEGLPISMLEAMAEARAVLVTDAGNMSSVVKETGCGWVLPDRRPATIAAALRRVADNPVALAKAGADARQAAATRYSASAQRDQIDAILASFRKR